MSKRWILSIPIVLSATALHACSGDILVGDPGGAGGQSSTGTITGTGASTGTGTGAGTGAGAGSSAATSVGNGDEPPPTDPSAPAPRSRRQQDHDALTLGLRALLDSGALGTRGKNVPHLFITLGLDALHDSPGALPAVAASGTLSNGTVRAYDLSTGRVLFSFDAIPTEAEAIAISPDGKTLAATTFEVNSNAAVYLYAMADGKPKAKIPYPPSNPGSVSDLILFTPDGTQLVIKAASGKALHLLDLAKGEVVRTFPVAATVFAAALSPDGKHLVVGGSNFETGEQVGRQFEVETGRELDPLPATKGAIRSLAFSPDGGVAPEWSSLAPGQLVLPELLLRRHRGEASLVVTARTVEEAERRVAELSPASMPLFDPSPVEAARVASAAPPEHFESAIERAVERIARGQNHSVTVAHTEDDLGVEQECFAQLVARRVSGVLLVPVDSMRTDLGPLSDAGIPVVLVDRGLDGAHTDVVATDNLDAGRQAARHLHERGFRAPAVIAGPQTLRTTEDRATGFLAAWRELGVELGAEALQRGDLHIESGRALMEQLLAAGEAE